MSEIMPSYGIDCVNNTNSDRTGIKLGEFGKKAVMSLVAGLVFAAPPFLASNEAAAAPESTAASERYLPADSQNSTGNPTDVSTNRECAPGQSKMPDGDGGYVCNNKPPTPPKPTPTMPKPTPTPPKPTPTPPKPTPTMPKSTPTMPSKTKTPDVIVPVHGDTNPGKSSEKPRTTGADDFNPWGIAAGATALMSLIGGGIVAYNKRKQSGNPDNK